MPREEDRQRSILVVSGSEQFDAHVRKALTGRSLSSVEFRKNAAAARRSVLERDFDIAVINCPLPEEFGHELALDLAEKDVTSVLMVVPAEICEEVRRNVTDQGIVVLAKPFRQEHLETAVRYLAAVQGRIRRLTGRIRTLSEKTEEIRIVSRAKLLLMEKRGMTENEAHRLIGRQAMDGGVSRKKAAERIIDELE